MVTLATLNGLEVLCSTALTKIGFGGGCHWCTEAVFQTLKGVEKVAQGWIASEGEHGNLSEAVLVYFNEAKIDLASLTAIHLYTHSCSSEHPMRKKYRSAVYTFSAAQTDEIQAIIKQLQSEFAQPIITKVLPFVAFKENSEQYQNYYLKNSENQFCQTYIEPKLRLLMQRFAKQIDERKKK
jgi:peptide-methionine (S)-S-oxide reductase